MAHNLSVQISTGNDDDDDDDDNNNNNNISALVLNITTCVSALMKNTSIAKKKNLVAKCFNVQVQVKHYRPGQAQRVPRS